MRDEHRYTSPVFARVEHTLGFELRRIERQLWRIERLAFVRLGIVQESRRRIQWRREAEEQLRSVEPPDDAARTAKSRQGDFALELSVERVEAHHRRNVLQGEDTDASRDKRSAFDRRAPSGITVFHAVGPGVLAGAATIFRFGVSLSTCRKRRPFATPNGK